MLTNPQSRRDRISYRRYYATGEDLERLNINLINTITKYVLSQHDPQVTKEAVEVISYITTVKAAEDILKYVICYEDMNEDLYNFLVKSITLVYNP